MSGTFPIGMLEDSPGSVLVVDDDAQIRGLLVALLKPRGYVMATAASAEEAQQQLKKFQPDVILLDLHLPGKSGQDVLTQLRSDPVTRLLPVTMITGGATGEDRLRAMAGGVTDFIAKPFAAKELLARLKPLVQMKRFTDALEHAEHVIVALEVVYGHHERLDGSGYPDGVAGESIPLTARVTTIADIYDALTTARVYRAALTREEALTIMAEEAGRGWWDPRLLDTFRSVLEGLPEDVSRVTNALAAPS
jgi:response regulator RpfG family c-di-GMP phosphodiesterase